ncbi:MAG TPA: alcohol dehydrogenase catalytic domain-containing protein, partial [Solirubrobacteraceae bacterium]
MRAVVTEGVRSMALRDVPDPAAPSEGQVLVRPDGVGLCGSDFHFFAGELNEAAGGGGFPRVQGHEVTGVIDAVGPGCRAELTPGTRVALMPLSACGACYPCRIGRPNVCAAFRLIGIHEDGGLQERLAMDEGQVHPITAPGPTVAALTEPVSIAMRAMRRSRLEAGERVVVLGAGPIGQALSLAAQDRGADVLLVDLVPRRLELGRELGAEGVEWTGRDAVVARARDWAGAEGAPVVIDATGVPNALRAAVDIAARAGRVVQVGMSPHDYPLRVGDLTEK